MKNKKRKYRNGRYFLKAFTAYMTIFMLFTVSICAIVYEVLPKVYGDMKLKEMEKCAKEFAEEAEEWSFDEVKVQLDVYAGQWEYGVVLLSEDEKIVYIPTPFAVVGHEKKPPEEDRIQFQKGQLLINEDGVVEVNERYWSYSVPLKIGNETYRLVLTSMRKPDMDMYHILRAVWYPILAAEMIFAAIISYLFARWMTKPVLTVARQARHMINRQSDDEEYKIRSSDEIKVLQDDLVSLYDNLQDTIQELKRSNEQLEEQIQVVQEMEKKKTEFYAAASHELKTPIAAATVMLEGMIDQTGSYKDRERYLRECRKKMAGLSKLVQNILDIAKLESFSVKKETVDVSQCLDKLIQEYGVLAERHMVAIQCRYDQGIFVISDGDLLQRALSNLLSNAVKYTPIDGQILLEARQERHEVIIRIQNETDPIGESVLENYKDAFVRPETERSGSGLGLYIVHQICLLTGYEFRIGNILGGVEASIRIPDMIEKQ